MKKRTVLLVVLAALAAGCGGDGDEGTPSTANTTAAETPSGTSAPPAEPARDAEEPARGTTAAAPRKEEEPPKGADSTGDTSAGSTRDSRRVERYLRDNFGGSGAGPPSDWYGHLVEVTVSGATTTIRTDLSGDRPGRDQARQICMDVRGAIPGITDTVRVTTLSAETPLAKCVP